MNICERKKGRATVVSTHGGHIAHIVLTRFNVKLASSHDNRNIDPQWLQQRFHLFEDICFPAVTNQTRLPDHWLVFLDANTPEAFLQRIEDCRFKCPQLTPVFCDAFSVDEARKQIRALLPNTVRWLITTRLDNDDAIHRSFVEAISSEVMIGRREFLNPTRGLVVSGHKFYRNRDYSNRMLKKA